MGLDEGPKEYFEDLRRAGAIDVKGDTMKLIREKEKAKEWLKKRCQ
ncbi:hypothetical protein KEJ19_02705 [Candidatus Bathyarchaeota archaeon]|nr:hypothetical protein [Candidatus Bathyarchaeota archaeon]